jgi:hypothetical protein
LRLLLYTINGIWQTELRVYAVGGMRSMSVVLRAPS